MNYRSVSLLPIFNNNSLSDRLTQMDNLFSRITGEKPLSDLPSYNLLQIGKEKYELTISVPGFSQDELDISILNNQLTISSKINNKKDEVKDNNENVNWLHNSIKKNDFSLSFNLEHRIIIQQASLENGLLFIKFNYDIPEREKPKKVAIGIKNDPGHIIEHKNV